MLRFSLYLLMSFFIIPIKLFTYTISIPDFTFSAALTASPPNLSGSSTQTLTFTGLAIGITNVQLDATFSPTSGFNPGDSLKLQVAPLAGPTTPLVDLYPAGSPTTCFSGSISSNSPSKNITLSYAYTSTGGSVKQAGNLTGTLTLTATSP